MRSLTISVSILAISLLLAVPVVAQQHETEFEEETNTSEREISIEHDTTSVRIESSFEIEDGEREREEEFSLSFDVEEHPSIELERSIENETATTEQENGSSYEVTFKRLQAVNTEGQMLEEAYDLEDADFKPINHTKKDENGSTVHVIEATTVDDVFTLRLYAAGDFTDVEGANIGPTEVKIDILIRNRSRDSGYVGLMTEVDAESESELEFEDGSEIRQKTRSGEPSAFFSWKDTAQVDGATTAVRTETVRSDDDEHDLLFMYEPGSTIIHDPKIGLSQHATGGNFFSWLMNLLFRWL